MIFYGLNKTTLLDYPSHVAATLFTGGCNFRCPFCHNASLVTNPSSQPPYTEEEILAFLKKRHNILDGICITGGEPTLCSDLESFIQKVKDLGYLVKLDSNGFNTSVLEKLIHHNLIDYVAMDIKNSLPHYGKTIGLASFDTRPIEESVSLLRSSSIPYEFRTTLVKELHTEEDILSIGEWLKGVPAYYLQSFIDSGDILMPGFHAHEDATVFHYRDLLLPFIPSVQVRGIMEN